MDGDIARKETVQYHNLKKVICASAKLGVNMVTTFIGRDQSKNVEDNLLLMREIGRQY